MALDPRLKDLPDYAGEEFEAVRTGLQLGYNENNQEAIVRLVTTWQENRDLWIAAWNARREDEARAAEAVQERRLLAEEEDRVTREDINRELREAEKKKPKMNSFVPGSSATDVLIHRPLQYALQKLSSFDFIELWYFTLKGRLDAAKYSSKSQANDTFGLSRVDEHLTVRSIASVRASCLALPDHQLTFSEFLSGKNVFLEYAQKAEWPLDNLDAPAKFFGFLKTHPSRQLPLGEKIVLTYTAHVRLDWHSHQPPPPQLYHE